jgi:hypothetical protein
MVETIGCGGVSERDRDEHDGVAPLV